MEKGKLHHSQFNSMLSYEKPVMTNLAHMFVRSHSNLVSASSLVTARNTWCSKTLFHSNQRYIPPQGLALHLIACPGWTKSCATLENLIAQKEAHNKAARHETLIVPKPNNMLYDYQVYNELYFNFIFRKNIMAMPLWFQPFSHWWKCLLFGGRAQQVKSAANDAIAPK